MADMEVGNTASGVDDEGTWTENPVTGERVRFVKRARDTGGEYVRLEVVAEPGAIGPPPHVHPGQEEHFRVLAGTLTGTIDGEAIELEAGEECTVWPGTPHEWGNAGDDELRALVEVRPATQFEDFIETLFGLARDGKTNGKGVPNLLQMAVITDGYWNDTRLAGPPEVLQKLVATAMAPIGRMRGYRPQYPEYSPSDPVEE